ncbi:MAG: NAD(P)H-dependent oxidoreductase [Alphaproteobacteria bacterium]|nr:NAD(P)H-dependent oxidoreductase [Alphaproteobacteria bacterium]
MKKLLSLIIAACAVFTSFNSQAKENQMTENKILVAYFSATGTTAGVAERLASAVGADLFEIKPEQPYTEADLDWRNKQSRSSVEMDDMSSRPAIASKVENMSKYDVVFVGFPIWWYREPSIIDTFMESYDFAGKTVVPFATSGSSGMGKSGELMQKLAPNAKVLEGKRFPANVSADELKSWADSWL